MAGHDGAGRERPKPLHGGRPVHRVAVAEARRGAILEQVAGEEDAGARHDGDDLAVGVAAAVVAQLHDAVAHVEGCPVVEGVLGRVDHDLGQLFGDLRGPFRDPADGERAVTAQALGRPHVPPDGGGTEGAVAERVVPVPVRVDDDRDRVGRQGPEFVDDLAGVGRRGARVDEQDVVPAEDDPDLLVEEVEMAGEHAITDLDPGHLAGIVRAAAGGVGSG